MTFALWPTAFDLDPWMTLQPPQPPGPVLITLHYILLSLIGQVSVAQLTASSVALIKGTPIKYLGERPEEIKEKNSKPLSEKKR